MIFGGGGVREFCLDVDLKHIGGGEQRGGVFFKHMLQNTMGLKHTEYGTLKLPSISPNPPSPKPPHIQGIDRILGPRECRG